MFIKALVVASFLISPLLISAESTPTAERAFQKLKEGNRLYVRGEPKCATDLIQMREMIASQKQQPFAVVIGCSDSRVPPEIIFDKNLGDLFVIRVAGNVVGPIELDTVEFGVANFQIPLIVVLGHQSCGAVTAVVKGAAYEEDIENIVPLIQPSVDATADLPGDHIANAIKANVVSVVNELKSNAILSPLIDEGKLKVIGGYYTLKSGEVEWLTR